MYFSAQSGMGLHLWRQRYPDGTAQQLTFGPGNESMVVSAPDGKSLVAAVGLVQIELWIHTRQGERRSQPTKVWFGIRGFRLMHSGSTTCQSSARETADSTSCAALTFGTGRIIDSPPGVRCQLLRFVAG